VTEDGREVVRAWMPGAFARLGPLLADDFVAATGQVVEFAPFRPSGMLAQQILNGEHADVYVSANVLWMRRLQRAGCAPHWATLARNRLCLIARPHASVACLDDLARAGLKVVAPQAQTDPCGRYVEQLWRGTGLLSSLRAKQARGELLRSVGSGDLPAYLLDGRGDVGILYFSEALQLDPGVLEAIELPPEQDMHDRIRFVIAALTSAGRPFVRWLLDAPGQQRLQAAGFLV
jgi:molybdate transport system substrate-binding protein